MPLGKDSITKRVAKPATPEVKTPAKKPTTRKAAPKAAVLTNVAPETVEKVTGHKESAVERFGLGQELPYYLL